SRGAMKKIQPATMLKKSGAWICFNGSTRNTIIPKDSFRIQWQCDKCGETFLQKLELRKHKLQHRRDTEKSKLPDVKSSHDCAKDMSSEPNSQSAVGTVTGPRLSRSKTVTPQSCSNESSACESMKSSKVNTASPISPTKKEEKCTSINEAKHECTNCGKSFRFPSHLIIHRRNHEREKLKPKVKCQPCRKTFTTQAALSRHKKVTHEESKKNKKFVCMVCNTVLQNSSTLVRHMISHSGMKQHTCDICSSKKDNVRNHIISIHYQVKRHTCPVCHQSFKGHLSNHMRIHSKEKPYECAHCKVSFCQKSQLLVHLRIHTGEKPYSCSTCGKSFAHSSVWKAHERKHTGVRPYSCQLCPSQFVQLPHLKKHMRRIHSQHPYLCMDCKSSFQKRRELEDHISLQHKKKAEAGDGSNLDIELGNNITSDLVKSRVKKFTPTIMESTVGGTCEKRDNQPKNPTTPIKGLDPVRIGRLCLLRELVGGLMKKITSMEDLQELGYGVVDIDEVLEKSLLAAGFPISENKDVLSRLEENIIALLRWTIPKRFQKYLEQKHNSVELILKELTS
ncbi:unnamed protein product, partial [Darwinula stevensoni]